MIKPTIGRVVLFTPAKNDTAISHYGQEIPALVCHVWGDRCINIGGFDSNGKSFGRTSVPLLQDDDAVPEHGFYCEWMPYQKGQAAKTEELEKKLKDI
jgi:hypothetical protein